MPTARSPTPHPRKSAAAAEAEAAATAAAEADNGKPSEEGPRTRTMQQRHLLEQAGVRAGNWLKEILEREHHSNEELARSLTDSPIKARAGRPRHDAPPARPPPPLLPPPPPPAIAPPPAAAPPARPAAPACRCSPFGWRRRRRSCFTGSPRRRRWWGAPRARASSSAGARAAPGSCHARLPALPRVAALTSAAPTQRLLLSPRLPPTLPPCRHSTLARAAPAPAPRGRLPTTHPTLIRFSAPLFLDISFTSVGLSLGRSSTAAFVAVMGRGFKQQLLSAGKRRLSGLDAALLCGASLQDRSDLLTMNCAGGAASELVGVSTVRGGMLDLSFATGGISVDAARNAEAYGAGVKPSQVLDGTVDPPPEMQARRARPGPMLWLGGGCSVVPSTLLLCCCRMRGPASRALLPSPLTRSSTVTQPRAHRHRTPGPSLAAPVRRAVADCAPGGGRPPLHVALARLRLPRALLHRCGAVRAGGAARRAGWARRWGRCMAQLHTACGCRRARPLR